MRFRRRNKKQDEASVDLTPMLDIVFIMLIFFVVTSQISQQTQIKVDPATASSGTAQTANSVRLQIDANQQLYVDGVLVPNDQLIFVLKNKWKMEQSPALVIEADQKVPTGFVIGVMDQARQIGMTKIALGTEPKS